MSRTAVEVSLVGDDSGDLRDLTGLWLAARVADGMSPEVASRTASEGRLEAALRRPEIYAHVARLNHQPVGYALSTHKPYSLNPDGEVALEQMYVDPAFRRHGVARALLSAIVALAERTGSDVIVSNVPTRNREAQRFFARLGFSSVIVRRVVPTGHLRRRLGSSPARESVVDQVVRRRRSSRTTRTDRFSDLAASVKVADFTVPETATDFATPDALR